MSVRNNYTVGAAMTMVGALEARVEILIECEESTGLYNNIQKALTSLRSIRREV